MSEGTIKTLWEHDDTERQPILEQAERCAALSKPHVMPPVGHMPSEDLPEPFQSLGSWGMTNLESKMLAALFPADTPWFHVELAPHVLYNPSIQDEKKQAAQAILYLRDLQIQAMLESAGLTSPRGMVTGFRSNMRQGISSVLITGDTLQCLDDDYRVKTFRRRQYVTRRDSAGDVVYHIIREEKDPLALKSDHFAKAGLERDELSTKTYEQRKHDLFTYVEWQPWSKKWVIEQEMNGRKIVRSEEPESPYFATPFELVPGEHYGRGLIELNKGDLSSLDTLSMNVIDFAGYVSKVVPCIEETSNTREEDLTKRSGDPIRTRVVNGAAVDIAMLRGEKLADFTVVDKTIDRLSTRLSKTFLLTDAIRPSERTTAAEVRATIAELEGALGGFYTPVADMLQLPLLRRAHYQLVRDRLLKPLPKGIAAIQLLTGLAALVRLSKATALEDFAQVVSMLGPAATARLNTSVLMDVYARYRGVYEPGLIKTDDQVAEETRAEEAALARQQAAQTTIETTGRVVENALATQGD